MGDSTEIRPDLAMAQGYIQIWDNNPRFDAEAKAVAWLFRDIFPQNIDINHILTKVGLINSVYHTHIYDLHKSAERILGVRDIDARLHMGCLDIVAEIAGSHASNHGNYSFATKYCYNSNITAFPIFDSRVSAVLSHSRNNFGTPTYANSDLYRYDQFLCVLANFKTTFGLNGLSITETDKFLWLFGDELIRRKKDNGHALRRHRARSSPRL